MNLSGQESGAVTFPREQYEALESAVMESARGRWFLAEYARRNRAADTMMLISSWSEYSWGSRCPIDPECLSSVGTPASGPAF